MDNDNSSKALGLEQQINPVESSPSESSSGWGTCSELLLVSAVKKHGVPNWNLVALELKSCAIRLNMSPSLFSEEACKFKYNSLKVRFASNSNSSGDVLDDDDLNAVSWFEELRKLRMFHLKEELQVSDSSIGQLQSRISRLKEERAQHLSLQSVTKQSECSCGGMDTHMNGCEALDVKGLTSGCCPSEPLERMQDLAVVESVAQGELTKPVTGGLERCPSTVISQEGNCLVKDVMLSSSPNCTIQDSTEDLGGRSGYVTTEMWSSSDTLVLDGKVTEKSGNEDCHEQQGAFTLREDKVEEQEPGKTSQPCNSDQTTRTQMREENLCQDIVNTGVDSGAEKLGYQENVGVQNQEQGKRVDSGKGGSSHPFSVSMSESRKVDVHKEGLLGKYSETLVLTTEVLQKAPEGEGDSISKEFGHSRLSLTYGRADKERKMKATASMQPLQVTGPESQLEETMDDQSSKITNDTVKIGSVEGKEEENCRSVLMDQCRIGKPLHCDQAPVDIMEVGPIQEDCSDTDDTDKALESVVLDEGKRDIPTEPPSSNMDLVASPSFDRDLLPIASGPKPYHILAASSKDVPSLDLYSSPDTKGEQEVALGGCAEFEAASDGETPHGMLSPSPNTGMEIVPNEGKSSEECKLSNAVNMEGDILKVEQEAERVVQKVYMSNKCGEARRLRTDCASSRSLGDEVSETIDGDVQEESRDAPEINEVQQPFPDYTDSQIDKSEVGSSLDSIEDMSPSSRKNRREPKVSGKFLPLLECLRVICGHKFAPLFKQRQEHQDNAQYDRLVRRHVDLSIVRTRLEEGAYSGSVEFFRDLLLIFTNALVCNSSDSPEYAGAKALRSCALIEMDKILQTEALLKQNGPATRKREIKKSMEVHKMRISSTSGSESRKKGILKSTTENAALDLQGGARSAHLAFDDTSHAGRSPNSNEDRGLDRKFETYKMLTVNRVVKEETPRKESQKPEQLRDGQRIKPDMGFESKRKESLKPGLLSEGKRKELQKPGLLAEGKRKDPQKSGLLSERKRKELQKPGLSEGKQKDTQKPGFANEGKRKESQKPASLAEGKSKELQKSGLHSEGRRKESQKPGLHSEGKRRDLQKPVLLNESKRKELQSPDFLSEGRRKDSQKPELLCERKRESQKPDLIIEANRSGGSSMLGKKTKVDGPARKGCSEGDAVADVRVNGGQRNVDNVVIKTTTAKMKDVMCIDSEKKVALNNSSNLGSAGLPSKKQQNTSISRQNSTSRVSRHSKRGGDSTISNPKKRARK